MSVVLSVDSYSCLAKYPTKPTTSWGLGFSLNAVFHPPARTPECRAGLIGLTNS